MAATPLTDVHRRSRRGASRARIAGGRETHLLPLSFGGERDRAAVRDALLAVETTLRDGQTARFGSNAVKDVAGYDMKRLFIGGTAFGTLERVRSACYPRAGSAPISLRS